MGKNKLRKFAEMELLPNVLQCPYGVWANEGFPYLGKWHTEIFKNNNPITLELGCGRGEYTLGLAKRYPERNFIGIDVKGNRMWNGATIAHKSGLKNVRFLRTEIELLPHLFGMGEVSEIWLTFPDPQMKKLRKRLTSVRFLHLYKQVLRPEGRVKLKTDSRFLYTFTQALANHNGLTIHTDIANVDLSVPETHLLRSIQTYYESQWRKRGISIKYLEFGLENLTPTATNPDVEIAPDTYRSYGRERRSQLKI